MALADRIRRYVPVRQCDTATPSMVRDTLPQAAATRTLGEDVALSRCRSVAVGGLLDTGTLAAVLLRGTCWGEVWLVADDEILADHPDIAAGGLPVIRFAELPHLQRLDAASLQALGIAKRTFPTARVLQ